MLSYFRGTRHDISKKGNGYVHKSTFLNFGRYLHRSWNMLSTIKGILLQGTGKKVLLKDITVIWHSTKWNNLESFWLSCKQIFSFLLSEWHQSSTIWGSRCNHFSINIFLAIRDLKLFSNVLLEIIDGTSQNSEVVKLFKF